jgi:hypothetical protein
MAALPVGIRLVFRPVIVFDQPKAVRRYWVLDFRRWEVFEAGTLPEETNSVIRVHGRTHGRLVEGHPVFCAHLERMRISVRKRGMKEEFKFWGLLQL